MRITRVETYGMDKLISGYKDFQNEDEYIKYGKKLSQFFENTEITLYLSDIKGIELLILRKFCSSIVLADSNSDNFEFIAPIGTDLLRYKIVNLEDERIPADKLTEIGRKIHSNHASLKRKLPSEKENELYWASYPCCDCGSFRFKVVARFEGVNITALLSAFPETVFRIHNGATLGHVEYVEAGSKEMETLIIKAFIKNFFNYMEETLSQVDTLTDVQFNRNYFDGLNLRMNDCILSHIRTPYGFVDWSTIEDYEDFMKSLSKVFSDAKYSGYEINTLKDFTYHFMINSTMESLILFSGYSNLVYYYQDLKVLNGQASEVSTDLTGEFRRLFMRNINELDEYRLKVIKDLKEEETRKTKIYYNRTEIYEFIPRGAHISFAIHGTEREILQFIAEIKSRDILTKEMNQIITDLKNTISLVNKTIKKINS